MKRKERSAAAPMKGHCFPPGHFSDAELDQFAAMVLSGGEVTAQGLDERIRTAAYLRFLYDRNGELCGVAALKRPEAYYRDGVFAKAETGFDPSSYAYELGWIVVSEKYRGQGLTQHLLTPLLKFIGDEPVYATTRIDNEPMRRSLFHHGFQTDGTHYRNAAGDAWLVLHLKSQALADLSGPLRVRAQFHGSPVDFDSFKSDELRSLGVHFGDIMQARHFAKEAGFIYQADLTFKNCLDIRNDWGWTSAQHVAFALHTKCSFDGIAHQDADFLAILGAVPWSMHSFEKTGRVSPDEQRRLVELFAKCGFDGVRYLNKFEPPGSVNRVAYFVTDPSQIEYREKKPVGEHKI